MNRTERALTYFKQGRNCAQSVFMAYCDLFGIPTEQGARLMAGMGGGMGGLRGKCGTVTACALLAGLRFGGYPAEDWESKKELYARIREMDAAFCEKFGETQCKILLTRAKAIFSEIPAKRDESYYASRPCCKFVEGACEIVEQFLLGEETQKNI